MYYLVCHSKIFFPDTYKITSVCVSAFQVVRIWKEEDILLDSAFKATVSVNMAAWLSSLAAF